MHTGTASRRRDSIEVVRAETHTIEHALTSVEDDPLHRVMAFEGGMSPQLYHHILAPYKTT